MSFFVFLVFFTKKVKLYTPGLTHFFFSIDTCAQDFKLQKLLEAYRQRSALENEQQPLQAMVKLNTMVADFLRVYELSQLSLSTVQKIPHLARCETYEVFLEAGKFSLRQLSWW